MVYFEAKMHQIRFRLGREAYSAPQTPIWIQGHTSKAREGGKGEMREGKGERKVRAGRSIREGRSLSYR